jgi:hypothetical protein
LVLLLVLLVLVHQELLALVLKVLAQGLLLVHWLVLVQ